MFIHACAYIFRVIKYPLTIMQDSKWFQCNTSRTGCMNLRYMVLNVIHFNALLTEDVVLRKKSSAPQWSISCIISILLVHIYLVFLQLNSRWYYHQKNICSTRYQIWKDKAWRHFGNTVPEMCARVWQNTRQKCTTLSIPYTILMLHLQHIPRNMHTVLLCFALLCFCNRS